MDGSEATLIGDAALLIELARLRLLIDPPFGPPGDYQDRGAPYAMRIRTGLRFAELKRKQRNPEGARRGEHPPIVACELDFQAAFAHEQQR
jgi:L-ascorbate metabolism protein UlaG (beta-lactamase superfamily)